MSTNIQQGRTEASAVARINGHKLAMNRAGLQVRRVVLGSIPARFCSFQWD